MTMIRNHSTLAVFAIVGLFVSAPGLTATFGNILTPGVEFPLGAVSFADAVVDYSPGIVYDPGFDDFIPFPIYRVAESALGVPDVVDIQSVNECTAENSTVVCPFVSLGVGGSLTVQFTDNLLTGGGTADADLWIFEAGPPEPTYVDISPDGINWFSVGLWPGFTIGVDIDAFGFGVNDSFAFVRLTDDPISGNTTGITVGADIDAIGAISSVTVVPLPAAAWLFASALSIMGLRCRRSPSAPVS